MATVLAESLGRKRQTRAFNDLREYLDAIDHERELLAVPGAHWDLEVGAITEVGASRRGHPALLFEQIQGYDGPGRVLTNFLSSVVRERLIYGCPMDLTEAQSIYWWKEQLKEVASLAPRSVADGPIFQHVATGSDVDLSILPWIRWHEHDGGRYMCATSSVTRDPDTGYVNVGSYRYMLIDNQTMVVHIGSGHHGDVIRKKYWSQGKPCPIAISLGNEPSILVSAGTNLAYGEAEYGYAGWLRGEPVDVVKGPITGLPIPATAEAVIEAEMYPPDTEMAVEGPFGEASGYYGGGAHPTPLTKVHAVLHRDDPIIMGAPPFQNSSRERIGSRAVRVWAELEALGIPGIEAVNYSWGLCIIGVKQSFPGHAMRAALGALGGTAGYHGRVVILVDEDVNVYDSDEVLWAVATRCDPGTSVDICRRIWSYRIDPRLDPGKREAGDYTGSVMIVDATRPYHWKDRFPATTSIDAKLRAATEAKWGALLDRK